MKKSAPHQQQLFRKLMLAIQQSEVDFSNYRVQFFFFNCISANSYSIQFNYLIIVLTPFRERKRERSTYIQQFYCVLRNTKQHDLSQYCCQQENFQQEKAYYKYCLLNVIRSKFICDNLLRCFLQLCYKQYLGKHNHLFLNTNTALDKCSSKFCRKMSLRVNFVGNPRRGVLTHSMQRTNVAYRLNIQRQIVRVQPALVQKQRKVYTGKVVAQAVAEETSVNADQFTSLRIKLKSYWLDRLSSAVDMIRSAASLTNAKPGGQVFLPTRRRIYCVLRSPHVNKDSREHFEIRTHQRLIDIQEVSAQTIDALMDLDLPYGVDVQIKM
eukprot:TRINITY_DN2659_c1_g1_i3.p1 TRINITY_DN2659_c1_g1~~TRINITY_DN2659_c1_g1_i3.p1  ORF type:complete len:325 (+),score=3.67 TRINITY_DN2659_c1_g1_i3:813-1787(+)